MYHADNSLSTAAHVLKREIFEKSPFLLFKYYIRLWEYAQTLRIIHVANEATNGGWIAPSTLHVVVLWVCELPTEGGTKK